MNKEIISKREKHKVWLGFFCSIVFVCFLFQTVGATPPKHFSEAKRLARRVFLDHRVTFYCGCKYDKHGKVDLRSCGYQIQKNKKRARRLEWEHIVPVSLWGKNFLCWKEAICCKKKRCYKGRSCCRETDAQFAKIEADLHNLVPEIGELNALRSNYQFGVLPQVAAGQFGICEMKVDNETRQVEPRLAVRGMIARAYLYMADTYNILLSRAQRQLFVAWNTQYPPEGWEITRDNRIAYIQGNHNAYVLHYEDKK